jgi:hypothetical protein
LSREVSFSILATLEALSLTFNAYLPGNFKFPLAWVSSLPRDYWIEQMCVNNWCAREAAIASANFNSAHALHYLSKVKKSYKDDCHRHCTQEECEGMQIDLAKCKPRHYDPRCNCSIVSIDNERLNDILVRILGMISSYWRQFQDLRVDAVLNPWTPTLTNFEIFQRTFTVFIRSNANSNTLNRRMESFP